MLCSAHSDVACNNQSSLLRYSGCPISLGHSTRRVFALLHFNIRKRSLVFEASLHSVGCHFISRFIRQQADGLEASFGLRDQSLLFRTVFCMHGMPRRVSVKPATSFQTNPVLHDDFGGGGDGRIICRLDRAEHLPGVL